MEVNKSFLQQYEVNNVQENAKNIELVTIYKNTSRPRAKKGCRYYLHILEPTGIEVIKNTTIKISFNEKDITGSVDLYLHNTNDIKRLSKIDVKIGKTVTIEENGELFFSINAVKSLSKGLDKKFQFTISLEFTDSSTYLINPILDIRTNKISNHNISNAEIFRQRVLNDSNKEYGMLMISNNSRVYMPKSKYIPENFNPVETLNLYENIISSYNKLAGFDTDDEDFLFRPREQFILISARNNAEPGSVMIDTLPQTSRLYFNDYWDIFFQFAKLFEQNWSLLEIWTNMYTIYMGNKIKGVNWLWETSREDFENNNIEPIYNKYLIENKPDKIIVNSNQEIYMILSLLESLGANFITKLERYSKENKSYLVGIEYILYHIAKLFGKNALLIAEIYGQNILDKAIINNIIDMSENVIFYTPFNRNFDKYKDTSLPVIVKSIYVDEPIIIGFSNPNANISIQIRDTKYFVTADYTGKFVYKIDDPIRVGEDIIITSRAPFIQKTVSKTFNIVTRLDNNSINFIGINGYLIAKVLFDTVKKELIVISTGQIFNISGEDKTYFTLTLRNRNGIAKKQAIIKEKENANSFRSVLNGQSFEYMDNITLTYRYEGFVFISRYDGNIIYNPKGQSEKFNITSSGLLEYF